MDAVTQNHLERIVAAKEARRRELAALPFAEKVRIVVQLQTMAAPILRARGKEVTPWDLGLTASGPVELGPSEAAGTAGPTYPSSRR